MFTLIKTTRPFLSGYFQKLKHRLGSLTIKRSTKTYLQQQGWRLNELRTGSEWQGYYRTRYGSFKGRVLPSASTPRFYLYQPPETLKAKHPHGACFSALGNGWYSVHFRRVPKDLDSGVMTIERILTECMRLK
jgi:hypothetical protein